MNYLQIIEIMNQMQENTRYVQLFTYTREYQEGYRKYGDRES